MADLAYRNEAAVLRRGPNWGAVWAGMFVFVGIWSVFGMLGEAIFASAASPTAARPISGMGWGIGIWSIILTIIAMYVAGRVTGHLSGARDRHDALLHGLTMFGLSVVGAAAIVILGGAALSGGTGVNTSPTSGHALSVFAGLGWAGFLSLFFGWLGAMWGASSAVTPSVHTTVTQTSDNIRDIRAA